MMRTALSALLCLLLTVASGVSAEVYTYTDAQGNQVFTDQPRKNAKRVPLPPSNNLNQTPLTVKKSPATPAKKAPLKVVTHYDMLRILAPEPDGTVNQSSGELVVTVTSDPALYEGDQYQILLDGNPVGSPGTSPVIMIKPVDRGLHQLAAQIIDSDGETVERTAPQKLNMQRISLAQKRRNDPCEAADWGVRPECPLSAKPCEKDDYGVRPQCPLSMKPTDS
ncbi:DUF4124 domain-containing protein [Pseudomonas baltica]|uniref:DUF4124 domain-containing protein n=1 Tax=Pseudomonas baltica TaxID=2762576 RepID=UPI00289EFFFB|nr:DUF4124 domain-containing protein [Pseudomonas baltica]